MPNPRVCRTIRPQDQVCRFRFGQAGAVRGTKAIMSGAQGIFVGDASSILG